MAWFDHQTSSYDDRSAAWEQHPHAPGRWFAQRPSMVVNHHYGTRLAWIERASPHRALPVRGSSRIEKCVKAGCTLLLRRSATGCPALLSLEEIDEIGR